MKNWLLLFLVVLAGCASVKKVTGPNGEIAYQVQCGKAATGACTSKADDLCPHGYNLIDRNSDLYDDLTKVGNLGKLEIKADTTETMLIQCR
jgi:hypothetical protein